MTKLKVDIRDIIEAAKEFQEYTFKRIHGPGATSAEPERFTIGY